MNRKIIKEYKRRRILVACQAFGKELSENVNQTPSSQAAQGGARHGERGRPRGERKQHNKYLELVISQLSRTIAESFSKEQLTRNASATLSVSKYQHNNFHYFQTTGTTGTLLEILSEHTPGWLSILIQETMV